MTGLREYTRDLEPCRQHDGSRLVVPTPEMLTLLIGEHLAGDLGRPQRVALEYARWKPGVALVTTWRATFEEGLSPLVTYKAYAGAKAAHVAAHFQPDTHATAAAAPLAPFAALPEQGAFLTTFPVDRVLRGAGRALNLRRSARHLDRTLWAPWVLQLRASDLVPVRYKPERRLVLRLKARLRGEGAERDRRRLGVRVLPLEVARRVSAARAAVHYEALPRLVAQELEAGILLEEWLPGEVRAPDDFSQPGAVAALVAGLHACPTGSLPGVSPTRNELAPLAVDPVLEATSRAIPPAPEARPSCWIHGDLHPDQVLSSGADPRLLDLDALRPGVPEQDLASWTADHLDAAPDVTLSEAAGGLLDGYRAAGGRVDTSRFVALVARGLAARAAAGIRRLEAGAYEHAARRLERARAALTEEVGG